MKRLMYLFALFSVLVISSCSSNLDSSSTEDITEEGYVTFHFEPNYDVKPLTRAATSISDVCNKLVVKVVDESGSSTLYTQSSSDANFGTLKIGVNSTTSSVYSLAYWGDNTATISDGGVTTFSNNEIVDAFFATTGGWKLYEKSSVNVALNRVSAKVKLGFTEAEVPAALNKMVITITGGTNVINGTEPVEITKEFTDISTGKWGTKSYESLLYIPTGVTKVSVKATAYNSSNNVIQERTFDNVPVQANYVTTISGKFFYDGYPEFIFSVDADWNIGETINY